jgi:hypothetical protein
MNRFNEGCLGQEKIGEGLDSIDWQIVARIGGRRLSRRVGKIHEGKGIKDEENNLSSDCITSGGMRNPQGYKTRSKL